MDIAEWLRGLGLEQYEPAFRDNFVDADVLPDLTAEDLVGLGVTALVIAPRLPARDFHINNPGLRAGVSTWFQTHLC
jgi:hypothetical protein